MGLINFRIKPRGNLWGRAAIAVLGITARAFCYQVEAIDISGNKYFPAVNEAIAKAQKSINVVMFTIESSSSRQDSKPNQLINALIEAKNRVVDVGVILDQNVDFVKTKGQSTLGTVPLLWESKI